MTDMTLKAYSRTTGNQVHIGDDVQDFRGTTGRLNALEQGESPGKSGKVVVNIWDYARSVGYARTNYDNVWNLRVVETPDWPLTLNSPTDYCPHPETPEARLVTPDDIHVCLWCGLKAPWRAEVDESEHTPRHAAPETGELPYEDSPGAQPATVTLTVDEWRDIRDALGRERADYPSAAIGPHGTDLRQIAELINDRIMETDPAE